MVKIPMYDSRGGGGPTDILTNLRYRARRLKPITAEQSQWLIDRGITIEFETEPFASFLVLEEKDALAFKLAFPEAGSTYRVPNNGL